MTASRLPPLPAFSRRDINALSLHISSEALKWRSEKAVATMSAFRADPRPLPSGQVMPATTAEEIAYQAGRLAGAGEFGELLMELLTQCADPTLDDEPSPDSGE